MLSSRRTDAMLNAATFNAAAHGGESRCWLLGPYRPLGKPTDQGGAGRTVTRTARTEPEAPHQPSRGCGDLGPTP